LATEETGDGRLRSVLREPASAPGATRETHKNPF